MEFPNSTNNGCADAPVKGAEAPEDPITIPLVVSGNVRLALEQRAADLGVSAADLARRAVEEMLRRERVGQNCEMQRVELPPSTENSTISVACDGGTENVHLSESKMIYGWRRDLVSAATKRTNDLYTASLQEIQDRSARYASRKQVLLRQFYPNYAAGDGTWRSNAEFSLPVSKVGWLVETLQQMQTVMTDKARANRAAALATRQERPADEGSEERRQRQFWIEKRGRDAWRRAVSLASRHRTGAMRLGLAESFTATQWLTLCDRLGFRCAVCGAVEGRRYGPDNVLLGRQAEEGAAVRLQPHHSQELSRDGDNTIENIWPICGRCHILLHEVWRRINTTPSWPAEQRALCERLEPGALVAGRGDIGVVVAVTPPERLGREALTPLIRDLGMVWEEDGVSVWSSAMVQVRRWSSGVVRDSQDRASDLRPLDEDEARIYRARWAATQSTAAAFAVGDLVRPRYTRRTHRSQIIEILPPDPALLIPARAVLRNVTSKGDSRTVEVVDLLRISSKDG